MTTLVSKQFDPAPGNSARKAARTLPISGFGGGTLIRTTDGPVPVDWLRPGDDVVTFDGGSAPVRWVGRDCLMHPPDTVLAAQLKAIDTGTHSTLLAARHRVVLTGWQIELNFGLDAVLAEAGHITEDATLFPKQQTGSAACSLVLFDTPQIIQANGFWVETLQLSDTVLGCLAEPARDKIHRAKLDLSKHRYAPMPTLNPWEATELRLDLEAMIASG